MWGFRNGWRSVWRSEIRYDVTKKGDSWIHYVHTIQIYIIQDKHDGQNPLEYTRNS
jgi:hypothetical protein